MGPSNHVLDGGPDPPYERGRYVQQHIAAFYRITSISCFLNAHDGQPKPDPLYWLRLKPRSHHTNGTILEFARTAVQFSSFRAM